MGTPVARGDAIASRCRGYALSVPAAVCLPVLDSRDGDHDDDEIAYSSVC